MCILVAHHDLGPADGLYDPQEHLLVLRPTLTPWQSRRLARRLLTDAGIPQPRVGVCVRCPCGRDLSLQPIDPIAERENHVVSLAMAAVLVAVVVSLVGLVGGGAGAAAVADSAPAYVGDWHKIERALDLQCRRIQGTEDAACRTPRTEGIGAAWVTAYPHTRDVAYTLSTEHLGAVRVMVFKDTSRMRHWAHEHHATVHDGVALVGDRGLIRRIVGRWPR